MLQKKKKTIGPFFLPKHNFSVGNKKIYSIYYFRFCFLVDTPPSLGEMADLLGEFWRFVLPPVNSLSTSVFSWIFELLVRGLWRVDKSRSSDELFFFSFLFSGVTPSSQRPERLRVEVDNIDVDKVSSKSVDVTSLSCFWPRAELRRSRFVKTTLL